MTLEEALLWEQEILDDMEMLKDELIECRELIAELSEEESGNPNWSGKDEIGGRDLLPKDVIHQQLLNGVRSDYHYAHKLPDFYFEGIFASLTDQIDPDVMRMYREAQTRHFAGAIVGRTFVMAECYTPEGELIPGYKIPWNGNHGPYAATMKYQDDWASPTKLNRVRGQGERAMRLMDREYWRAKVGGKVDTFMAKYPYYIPEDEWNGPV